MTTQNDEVQNLDDDDQIEKSIPDTASDATNDAAAKLDDAASVEAARAKAAPSILDAINDGIEQGGASRKIQPKKDEQNQEDTRPRNADGTFKTETAEEKTARERAEKIAKETPEEKTAREAEEAKAAKKPDHINDPLEKGLNERTSERIKSLIETVKNLQKIDETHVAIFDAVVDTGMSPEEFSTMLKYSKGVRSTDPKAMEDAYQVLQSELRGLCVRMGRPIPEVNLLRDPTNKDLIAEIQAGTLTNARAHEIAVQRARTEHDKTTATRTSSADSEKKQAEADTKQGRADLDAFEAAQVKKDGVQVYKAKYDILVPMLQDLFGRMNPREWGGVFAKAYEKLVLPAAAAPVTPAPELKSKVPANQPLRTKTPAAAGGSGVQGAPKSALEAISQAIDGI